MSRKMCRRAPAGLGPCSPGPHGPDAPSTTDNADVVADGSVDSPAGSGGAAGPGPPGTAATDGAPNGVDEGNADVAADSAG